MFVVKVGGFNYLVNNDEPRYPRYSRNINEAKVFNSEEIEKFKEEVMKYSNIYTIKEIEND